MASQLISCKFQRTWKGATVSLTAGFRKTTRPSLTILDIWGPIWNAEPLIRSGITIQSTMKSAGILYHCKNLKLEVGLRFIIWKFLFFWKMAYQYNWTLLLLQRNALVLDHKINSTIIWRISFTSHRTKECIFHKKTKLFKKLSSMFILKNHTNYTKTPCGQDAVS